MVINIAFEMKRHVEALPERDSIQTEIEHLPIRSLGNALLSMAGAT
jgi:hypothetical protein